MSICDSIIKALECQTKPIAGRAVAIAADLPYKVVVDALGRMLDAGTVVRFGRKYSAEWALAQHVAALQDDALEALERCWHGRQTHPPGGVAAGTPRLAGI